MFNQITPEILVQCAYDDSRALQYAEAYQGILVSMCFDWMGDYDLEPGDGFICPQCHQLTQYTARCYFRDLEEDDRLCLSTICIKDGIQRMAREYIARQMFG